MSRGSWSSQHVSPSDKRGLISKLELARQSASEAKHSTKAYRLPKAVIDDPAFNDHGELVEVEIKVEAKVEVETKVGQPEVTASAFNPRYIPNPYEPLPHNDLTPRQVLEIMMNQDLQLNGRWVDLERRQGEILALFDAWGKWRYSHPIAEWNENLIKREPFQYGPHSRRDNV